MKYFFLVLLFLSNNIFSDYSKHPDAKEVIATLVRDHGFEKSYVIKILESAKKQEKILQSMSSPAEFTWTWDRYRKLFIESKILFPYKVLNYIDRLSMAHSVEPRSPFLDKELWEFCMTLNDRFRINNQETKYILKKVAEFYLPKEVIYRKKEGFVFPLYPYLIKNKTEIKQRIHNS